MKLKLYMHLYKIIVTYLFISVHSSVSSVKRKLQSNLNIVYLHSNWFFWKTQPKQKVFLEKVTFLWKSGHEMTFLQYTANPFQRKFSLQANDLLINTCLKKKPNHKKLSREGLRYLYSVLFLMRNENVILTSTNSWRLPLPAVIAKKQHALDSRDGFVVVMSDWTNLCLTEGWCDVEHTQSKYRPSIPLGDWLFSPSFTLSFSTSWIH